MTERQMVLKQLDDNTAVCFWLKRRSFSCIKHTVSRNREIILGRFHLPIKTTAAATRTIITTIRTTTISPSRVILVIKQSDAQKLFYNKFIKCLCMFRALCAHHQEVRIVLYSTWYHHTCRWPSGAQIERSILLTCAPDGHLEVWWYQMLYNKILTSWWWAHSARNM